MYDKRLSDGWRLLVWHW